MANSRIPPQSWLDFVEDNIKCDFQSGLLFWSKRLKGRTMGKSLGCIDSNGYVKTSIGNRACYAHQIVFYLFHKRWVKLIDHRDTNRANNSINNLRESNHSDNALNGGLFSTNTTGVRGVSLSHLGYKVTKQGKHKGYYKTLEEAADAYNN